MIPKTLAIWASLTLALSASAQADSTVTSSIVTVSNGKYIVYDYADPATKQFYVVIPDGLKTVRGLLVECNYKGGDSRSDWTFCTYYREFMHLHGFALVASAGDIPHFKAFEAFRNCLRSVGAASKHPELVNAPYAAVGFSAGGGFASTLITMDPDRTIAAGIIEARYNFTAFLPPNPLPSSCVLNSVLAIPSVLITGEGKEPKPPSQTGILKMVDEVFVPFRPMGAEYAWLELPGYGHEYAVNRQDLLIMPLLDLAVRTRYPKNGDVTKGPIKLLSIDSATGWVADNTTWKNGLTKIVPATQFKGDLGIRVGCRMRTLPLFTAPTRLTTTRWPLPRPAPAAPAHQPSIQEQMSPSLSIPANSPIGKSWSFTKGPGNSAQSPQRRRSSPQRTWRPATTFFPCWARTRRGPRVPPTL